MADEGDSGTGARPQKTNLWISRLGVLVGRWQWEAVYEGTFIGRGRAQFDWIEGESFLREISDAEQPEFPNVTGIIGGDDTTETYCLCHFDSRGIARIYQMSLTDGVWKLWRSAPGFSQRFTGTFRNDGRTIEGQWEASEDGSKWGVDFDLTYTRVG